LLLLIQTNPTNLFYNTALIKTELALKKSEIALERAEHLYASYPGNYAVLMNYADTLQATNHHDQAAMILIKGFRVFKHDIVLCEALARAEANRGRHAYAYFTQAQCQRLQGQHKDAIRQLKLVQKMTKNDAYLSARAEATIEEIKDFLH